MRAACKGTIYLKFCCHPPAIELAKELASTAHVSNIAVHTSDGLLETEISVDQSAEKFSVESQ
jgi:hypothetical protein